MSDADKDFKVRYENEGIQEAGAEVEGLSKKTDHLAASVEKVKGANEQLAAANETLAASNQRVTASYDSKIASLQKEQDALLGQILQPKKRQDALRQAEADQAKIAEALDNGMLRKNSAKPNAFAQPIEEAGKAAASALPKIRGLSQGVSRVARAFGLPGIRGAAGQFTLIGVAAAVTGTLVQKALETIRKFGEDSTPQIESLVNAMENVREKTYELEAAQRAYFRQVERNANMPETEASKAQARLRYLQEVNRFEDEMTRDRHSRDLTNLQATEDAGIISHQEALRRKYALDEEYNQKRLALEKKAVDDDLANKISQRDAEAGKLAGLGPQTADAGNAQMGTQRREDIERAKLKQLQDRIEKDRANIAKYTQEEVDAQDDNKALGGHNPFAKAREITARFNRQIAQTDLDMATGALPKQVTQLHEAEEANRKATESLNALKAQVDELTKSINKLNIDIDHDKGLAGQKKADLTAAAEAAKQEAQAKAIADRAKQEREAGITPGGVGSALMFDPRQKSAWDNASPSQRSGMTPPSLMFNPNAIDPATGRPMNPAQPKILQPWESGAQQQYDRGHYGGADPANLPAQLKPLADQYMKEWQEVTTGIIDGHRASVEELGAVKRQMVRDLATIKYQLQEIKNHGGVS